jgi:ABC-type transport system involved in multi-copper enzyme maturation permease subunit
MKFLAILKDSLREAVDTKVLYVTVALSLIFVLFVFSISFKPLSVQEEANSLASAANENIDEAFTKEGLKQLTQKPRYSVDKFEETNAGGEPWERGYHFQFLIESPVDFPTDDREKFGESEAQGLQRILTTIWYWAKDIKVKYVPTESAKEIRLQVDIDHTKATRRVEWPHQPKVLFGLVSLRWFTMPLEYQLLGISDYLVGWFGAALTLLLSIVVTAFFIPNMLRKGTVDMLLAKPMHRSTLLLYKFIGGMTFMAINTTVIMGGLWLVLGIRTGVWMNGLLLTIFIFTFQFAFFYAVSTLMAVLTRSPIVAILMSVTAWALLFGIGFVYGIIDDLRPEKLAKSPDPEVRKFSLPSWVYTSADVTHFLTPHYKDMDKLQSKLLREDIYPADSKEMRDVNDRYASFNWAETIFVTLTYIAVFVGFSCFWFAWKDY